MARRRSLSRKALLLGILPALGALVLVSLSSYAVTWVLGQQQLQEDFDALSAIVRDNVAASLAFDDPATAKQMLGALQATPHVRGVCVFDDAGQLFAQYVSREFWCASSLAAQPTGTPVTHVQRVQVGSRPVGTVVLVGSTRRFSLWMGAYGVALAGAALAAALAAILFARRMRDHIVAPLRALASTAERITATGDYGLRAVRTTDDEVGALADAFNQMLGQIQAESRLKDEFLALLSHELRTPLNSMTGWLQILKAGAPPQIQEKALASMERNARAQVRLVEDLLDVSRIVTGQLQVRAEILDLRDPISAAVEAIAPDALSKRVTVMLTLADSPCPVAGDRDRLQQVFGNLLSNALKFTDPDGQVTVTMTEDHEAWQVAIRDTGVGIAPGFLPLVFDRFRQSDASPTRRHGGLGLGLAIVKELVHKHGGRVDVESAGPGCGATFTVRVPSAVATARMRPGSVPQQEAEGAR